MKIYKKILLFLIIFSIIARINVARAETAHPSLREMPSPGEVISAINQYRQQNGLAPLTPNGLLSSLAQSQSDYQASIQYITHTGPGGSTPQERATSAGYGGGSFFYLSEIIYGGQNATTGDALSWWKNSGLHNSIMLDSKYTEIGAGVATDGSSVYFTAVLGGPTGGSSGESSGDDDSSTGTESQSPTQGGAAAVPVLKSTPGPDGSIVHTVAQGQSLWTIAAVYEIELDKLLALNGLTRNSFVFPGDNIIIQTASDNPAETDEPTPSPSPEPTKTEKPPEQGEKILGTPFSLIVETQSQQTDSLTPAQPESTQTSSDPLVPTIVIAAIIILSLSILASSFLQLKTMRKSKDDTLD